MLKLKLQYFGHLMWRVDSLEKTDAGRDWGQEEKGTTEDEMAGWHHQLYRHEFEWTPEVGDGQEAWRAAIHGVAKSRTWLSDWIDPKWLPFKEYKKEGGRNHFTVEKPDKHYFSQETEININNDKSCW